MNPRRSRRFTQARAALRPWRDWAFDLRYLPHHLSEILRSVPSNRDPGRLHLFNLDLHIGPIGDFREITSPLGVDVTEWTMSAHADLIGRHREPVLGFNARNWRRLSPKVVDRFLDRYGRYLDQFDGFITTTRRHSRRSFCLSTSRLSLCARRGTSNRSPISQSYGAWLDEELRRGVADGQLYVVANNLADQAYLRHFTGIESRYIPSLCTYTNAPYAPRDRYFAIASKSIAWPKGPDRPAVASPGHRLSCCHSGDLATAELSERMDTHSVQHQPDDDLRAVLGKRAALHPRR